MSKGLGPIQKKVLLLLEGGLALGLSGSPTRYYRILKLIGKEWQEINRQALHRAIRNLYTSRLIEGKENDDGSLTLVLSEEGKRRVLTFRVSEMKIPRQKVWDRKWRVVMFDIPEWRKKVRDALRQHLRDMGCIELQKSVFVHPYPCRDEVDFLVELYNVRPHVRQLTVESIDNELHLKKKLRLL